MTATPSGGARAAASLPVEHVFDAFATATDGLTSAEAAARLARDGPNVIRTHRTTASMVLARQLRSPLLGLLLAAALVSGFLGQATDAVIIGAILGVSVGLGFANEYRAERAAALLHASVRHVVTVVRDGAPQRVDVMDLVVGDVVHLEVGTVVPADVRLIVTEHLECDESILTGESTPTPKDARAVAPDAALAELASCAFMGTVVHEGRAEVVVVATGARTEFGRIATGLGERVPQTEFQRGLGRFSGLLARIAAVLSVTIFVVNVAIGRDVLQALLFSLAVAVGITPQLLPAVVSTSLAFGSRRLAQRKVLVKRLVCIEDLGDVDVLFTDKTGTLTDGRIGFDRAVTVGRQWGEDVVRLGLLCNDATVHDGHVVGGNPLDAALWDAPGARRAAPDIAATRRIAALPFDHDRRLTSVVVADDTAASGARLITKGAPEAVLERCASVSGDAQRALDAEFRAANRVIAVATRESDGAPTITPDDERDLTLVGFLVFVDRLKASAAGSVARLHGLGVTVKVITGDNAVVATTVCEQLGIPTAPTLTGPEVDALDDDALSVAVHATSVFARISPEQKARILRAERHAGSAVAFLGDGVNDALALHHADVGISVDGGTDVAKDAADVILLEQDLDVLADGVAEGRRIFANTIKYVRMGTSSNFGNMFSVTVAAAFLPFLPMLPSQILLNNLLYDASQMTIPSDHVDEEQLERPSHWDITQIRRFMLRFGPISSVFDFATFAVLLWGFDAGRALFRSGWFVESLATQTLVVFAIRTRRFPFYRSRPSKPLLWSVVGVVLIGVAIPESPLHAPLGFAPVPLDLLAVILGFVVVYLALVDLAKRAFFRARPSARARVLRRPHHHRVARIAARWTRHHHGAPDPRARSRPAASRNGAQGTDGDGVDEVRSRASG